MKTCTVRKLVSLVLCFWRSLHPLWTPVMAVGGRLSHVENTHCPDHKSNICISCTCLPLLLPLLSLIFLPGPQTDCLQRPWLNPWFKNRFGSVFLPSKHLGYALVYWGKFVLLPIIWGFLGLKMVDDWWSVFVSIDLIYSASFHISCSSTVVQFVPS
jgi:hypothetical protein